MEIDVLVGVMEKLAQTKFAEENVLSIKEGLSNTQKEKFDMLMDRARLNGYLAGLTDVMKAINEEFGG